MTFSCPGCGQHIQCDELWAGHQINCPACQAQILVPPSPPSASSHPLGRVPPGSPSRLSAGRTQVTRSSSGSGLPQRPFQTGPAKQKSPVVKYAVIGAVLVVIAAGVIIGLPYYQSWRENRLHKPVMAQGNGANPAHAAADSGSDTNSPDAASPAPPKEEPLAQVMWSLALPEGSIPKGRAHGSISKTDFVPDTAQLGRSGPNYVLSLLQNSGGAIDRGVRVYLHLPGGASPAGQSWTVSPDTRNPAIPEVSKLWKPNPKYAPREKRFYSEYALQLELGGPTTNGTIPGKIFLALPDAEQSVVAGDFKATIAAPSSNPQMAPAYATPAAATPSRGGYDRTFRQRYGIGR
jgi:DNA-directed RNA polymerase subunit RPC12/RpoP